MLIRNIFPHNIMLEADMGWHAGGGRAAAAAGELYGRLHEGFIQFMFYHHVYTYLPIVTTCMYVYIYIYICICI